MTKPKRYKRFSSEFKREAIMRASEEGMTDKAVCDELGVRYQTGRFDWKSHVHQCAFQQTVMQSTSGVVMSH